MECLVVAERLDGYIQAAQSLLVANTFSAVAIAQTRSAYRPCLCGLVFHESGVRRWAELDWFSGNCGPRIFEWPTGLSFVTVCLDRALHLRRVRFSEQPSMAFASSCSASCSAALQPNWHAYVQANPYCTPKSAKPCRGALLKSGEQHRQFG